MLVAKLSVVAEAEKPRLSKAKTLDFDSAEASSRDQETLASGLGGKDMLVGAATLLRARGGDCLKGLGLALEILLEAD